jgi:hypothetical protein
MQDSASLQPASTARLEGTAPRKDIAVSGRGFVVDGIARGCQLACSPGGEIASSVQRVFQQNRPSAVGCR